MGVADLPQNLNAADAAYDYVVALLLVDRAAGRFRQLDSPEEQRAFAERLGAYLASQETGKPLRPAQP